ncbi:MAG TPA: 16S rRNA (cytosine(1402)-N(4))-methyltransferase RsmH [Elusimicrobiales bacterium]|nr:16S rRNA (cytosine(1402)-N(4))-methyltransferase RsmH [Elusimicrobiales bacterium]
MRYKTFTHIPVLLKESADALITNKNGIYLDATLGLGGHSKYFLTKLGKEAKLIGIDRDSQAVKFAEDILKGHTNVTLKQANFADVLKVLEELEINSLDGVFFDLGLSSYQLEDAERGFSFSKDGRLDMRFDSTSKLTAEEIVNTYGYDKLVYILRNYGEERFAEKIAEKIIRERKMTPIQTTTHLVTLIETVLKRSGKIHPATRTFQALRIAVNDELGNVAKGLERVSKVISVGGRIAVISFHSLEDRIVKLFFKKLSEDGKWKLINKKPLIPATEEISANPRARSAKLRVIERKK